VILRTAYLGAVTLYDVETEGGALLKVARPNGTRTADPALPAGQRGAGLGAQRAGGAAELSGRRRGPNQAARTRVITSEKAR
jgi:hypothetical protein